MNSPIQSMKVLFSEICTLPRPVFVLVVGQFLNRLGAFVYPFFSLYLKDKAYSLPEIAGVMAALGVGQLVGPLAGGYLADAVGRRNTIVLSLISSATLLVAMFFVDNYILLCGVGAIYGFSVFLFGAPANALLTDLVPLEKRVTAFALFRLAINAGFAMGPALAGILYVKSPLYIFLGDALTTYAFAALAFFYLPHGLRTIEGSVSSPRLVLKNWVEAASDAYRNVDFRRFLTAVLLMGVSFAQVFMLLALVASDKGLSPAVYGMIMGFNGVVIMVIELPLTHWLKALSPRPVLAAGYALIGVGCGLFAFVETVAGFVLAICVFTIGEIVALPLGMAYSSALAPERYRGRYFGLRGMVWALSSLVGSVGVWGYGVLGVNWWLVGASFGLLGAVVILGRRKQGSGDGN